jgi:tetratricopeptide (TPR) repeat protein
MMGEDMKVTKIKIIFGLLKDYTRQPQTLLSVGVAVGTLGFAFGAYNYVYKAIPFFFVLAVIVTAVLLSQTFSYAEKLPKGEEEDEKLRTFVARDCHGLIMLFLSTVLLFMYFVIGNPDKKIEDIQTAVSELPEKLAEGGGFITIEMHEKLMREDRERAQQKLASAKNAAQQKLYEGRLMETEAALSSQTALNKSYEERVKALQKQVDSLQKVESEIPKDTYEEAVAAIKEGQINEADRIFEKLDSGKGKLAEVKFQRGLIAAQNLEYDKAMKFYDEAISLDPENSEYYFFAGQLSAELMKIEKAQLFLERGLLLEEKKNPPDYKRLVQINSSLGFIYGGINNMEKVTYHVNKAEQYLANLPEEKILRAKNYILKANIEYFRNDPEESNLVKALDFFSSALELLKEDLSGEAIFTKANAYSGLANIYLSKKDYSKAVGYMLDMLGELRLMVDGNDPSYAHAYNKLGDIYRRSKQFDTALQYHLDALDIYKKTYSENSFQVGMTYSYIGEAYMRKGDFEKAMENLKHAINIFETMGSAYDAQSGLASALDTLSIAYSKSNQIALAAEASRKSYEILKKISPADDPYLLKVASRYKYYSSKKELQ